MPRFKSLTLAPLLFPIRFLAKGPHFLAPRVPVFLPFLTLFSLPLVSLTEILIEKSLNTLFWRKFAFFSILFFLGVGNRSLERRPPIRIVPISHDVVFSFFCPCADPQVWPPLRNAPFQASPLPMFDHCAFSPSPPNWSQPSSPVVKDCGRPLPPLFPGGPFSGTAAWWGLEAFSQELFPLAGQFLDFFPV